ncbi:hypothetical protein VaNZ11_006753 [Volvox africanus]|uniref:Uncharacterized protein n=1 Tax=Volvox africanus TaxID=51714 RepID=A0ABQ5S1T4_9CHLO|nr:hypothetical protein VaNZ11_006753 [Volvox africanus]
MSSGAISPGRAGPRCPFRPIHCRDSSATCGPSCPTLRSQRDMGAAHGCCGGVDVSGMWDKAVRPTEPPPSLAAAANTCGAFQVYGSDYRFSFVFVNESSIMDDSSNLVLISGPATAAVATAAGGVVRPAHSVRQGAAGAGAFIVRPSVRPPRSMSFSEFIPAPDPPAGGVLRPWPFSRQTTTNDLIRHRLWP